MLPARCPFCRALSYVSKDEDRKKLQKRMHATDPHAYTVSAKKVTRTGHLVKTTELTIKSAALSCLTSYAAMGHSFDFYPSFFLTEEILMSMSKLAFQ